MATVFEKCGQIHLVVGWLFIPPGGAYTMLAGWWMRSHLVL